MIDPVANRTVHPFMSLGMDHRWSIDHEYSLDDSDVLNQLRSDREQGLATAEAMHRLHDHGPNALIEQRGEGPWLILWKQLTATMVLILLVAAVLSAVLGDLRDAIAILAIVVFNALLGFRQEYQAERAIAALKQLAVPSVRVRRDGQVQEISARDLVPGDLVLLEAGNLVPADGRLLEASSLRIQEASLTGESEPIDKTVQTLNSLDLPVGDRRNMVHMGTTVTYGRGVAVVTRTGMDTELGDIATAIQSVEREPTRLQKRLDQFGKRLAIAIFILITLIFGFGLLRGEELKLMFFIAVSLGVAAVPEGLPAVVTIALSLGAKRMLNRQALIRKLPAVETLGSVTMICSDKTGTLTENRMTVTLLDVAGERVDLTADSQGGNFSSPQVSLSQQPSLNLLLAGGTLCNDAVLDATLDVTPKGPGSRAIGDPTEAALVMVAAHFGLDKQSLENQVPRVAEVPFDSERKCMTTVHTLPADLAEMPDWFQPVVASNTASAPTHLAVTKGAVDRLLEISSSIWIDRRIEPLTEQWRNRIQAANNELAQNGMRVLTVAFRLFSDLPSTANLSQSDLENRFEHELIFVGGMGMLDPARPEVQGAVQLCKTAGIRPVMITGDHPLTAQRIAEDLGVSRHHGQTLTGQALEQLPPGELANLVESVPVYARVSPQHKLRIVEALQQRGHIVAMTGDGVNDAPALKQADIGVAMGITGTDVAKEAADMVLLDDNFATIVAAIREGRVIYDNIRKFIKYVLTGNCGELWAIALAPLWGMPLLLLPLQILWINLIADGLLAVALSVEQAEPRVMERSPYRPQESIFSRGVGRDIVWLGLLLGVILLAVGYRYWSTDQASWQTMVFSTLAFSRIFLVQTMRSERESLFSMGLFSNLPLLGIVVLTFVLQLLIIYLPPFQSLFSTTALSTSELVTSLLMSSLVFWAMECEKGMMWLKKNQVR